MGSVLCRVRGADGSRLGWRQRSLLGSALLALVRNRAGVCVVAAVGVIGSLLVSAPQAVAATNLVTYSASETIPVPPASSYAGSGGGDGWAVALTSSDVYNVFHHSSTLTVACHLQSNAQPCWNPETITDTSNDNFATSGQPGLWLDQSTGKLYVYATRTSDSTGGVVCIDTTQAPTNPNPFCGFTALTAVGDAPTLGGISQISDPAQVGSHWYAFNYVNGSGATGTRNSLLCFDLNVFSACSSQPYALSFASGSVSDGDYPPPAVAVVSNEVIVPVNAGSGDQLACFDGNAMAECSGSWPVSNSDGSYDSSNGAPYPLLSSSGTVQGFCLPTGADPCWTLAGASAATPSGMTSAIPATSGWNGQAVVLGPRVYVPNGNSNQVDCYDASASASCSGFPKAMSNLSLLYTVNPDPDRPTCLWVNADNGSAQIQNFDGYSGGGCTQYPIRLVGSSVIAPGSTCAPAAYSSLQVKSPAPSDYTNGTVTIDDGDGNPLPGLSNLALDSTGTLSLAGDDLSSPSGLPQFLITLNGAPPSLAAAQVALTWTGTASPSCQPLTTPAVPQGATGGQGAVMRHNPDPCTPHPVNCASGNFFHTFTDVSVPGRGPGVVLARTYNSQNASTAGIFGYGWSSTYDMHLTVNGDGSVTITAEDGSQVTATADGAGGFVMPAWADSTLTLANGIYSYTRQGDLTYNFDSAGQLTAITDPNGYTTALAYNGSGQLSTVTDPAGRAITFTFGTNGFVSRVTDPDNQATSYGYDANGNLTSVTDPMNRTWQFGYDTNHLMLTMQDPDTGTTTNVYDSQARVISQTDPANLVTTFSYSGNNFGSFGGSTTITYPHGIVETENYLKGLLSSITKGVGSSNPSTWQYTYDTGTYAPTSVIDPNNNVSTYIYDANGNVISATDADSRSTTASYNSFNEPVTITDPVGITTSYNYDNSGNLLTKTVTGVGGSPVETTHYTYGDSHPGDVTEITDAAGRVTDYTYDPYGDTATVTTHPSSGINDTTAFTYDILGRPACQASPDATATGVSCPPAGQPRVADTTSYAYDPDSELTGVTDPVGNSTSYQYNGDGYQTQTTDGSGNITETVYDADNRPTTVTTGYGTSSAATTTYSYDIAPGTGSCSSTVTAATYCTTVADPDGHVTASWFDAQNRQIEQNQPTSGVTATSYDPAGNVSAQVTTAGTASYGYDPANQLTSITYTNPASGYQAAPNVTYSYDSDGQRTQMTDGTGTTAYTYDTLERLQTVTNSGSGTTLSYGYNLDNNVTTITYPNNQNITYGYDGAGRSTTVTDWANNTTTYSYDANSNITSEALPNGDTSTVVYDNANQITGISDAPTANPSSPFATMSYTRNGNGYVASETDTGLPGPSTHSYTYDPRNEITNDSAAGSYSYDPAGNLTSQPATASLGYNTAGQLCYSAQTAGTCTTPPSGSTSYAYNTAGGRTTQTPPAATQTTFGYDQANRITSFTSPSGQAAGTALSGGEDHSIARASDGTVWTSGINTYGQLGNGTTTNSSTPVQVTGLSGITSVAGGGDQSIALKSDGTVWDWGLNSYGQLGDGNTNNSTTPVQVSGLTGVTAIGEGFYYGIALKSDGTVWDWGNNAYGQLGDGNTTTATTPVEVSNLTGVVAIAAGYCQNYALKSDGTVWSWGLNNYGQLGDGNTTSSTVPVQVSGLTGITSIAAGYYHGLAVKSDGTVHTWGLNQYGQLGDGNTTSSTTPVQVSNLTGVTEVAAGAYHSYALTTTGTEYAWGWNNYGQLGTGNTNNSDLPVQTLTSVTSIGSGRYFGLALKTDGTTWGWGYNLYGELADGTTTSKHSPGQLTPTQTNYNNIQPGSGTSQATYSYNGDGLRASKTVNGNTTQETWNIATDTGTPQLVDDGGTYYIYGPDGTPLEQISATGTLYYLHDQIGSTRAITSNTGTVLATYSYTPYGQLAATTGSLPPGDTNPFGYTGAYTDTESGLQYLINRYYDPATAQFLTRDPLTALTNAPYTYADDDPVNNSDPLGLFCYRLQSGEFGPPSCPLGPPDPNNPNEVATPQEAMGQSGV